MKVKQVRVGNFRNLETATVELDDSLNFFLGQNGQGKTNFLEAIYLLGNVRSFRQTKTRDLCRFEQEGGFVEATIVDELGAQKLKQIVTLKGREFYLNESRCDRASDIVGRFVFITFTPQDLTLIRGGPIERRQFLEKCCVDLEPDSLSRLVSYYRAIRHKTEILKQGQAPVSSIAPWNELLCQYGDPLWTQREKLLALLETRTQSYYRELAGDESTIGLRLYYSGRSTTRPDFHEELRKLQNDERFKRRSLVGPHRDEVVIELNGKAARSFASQGQVRSIVLALRLASIELVKALRGQWPVVLFDDVDSELDKTRSANLFRLVSKTAAQVLVTSTERCSVPETLLFGSKIFSVSEGRIDVTRNPSEPELPKVVN